jgi:hypothetical protein
MDSLIAAAARALAAGDPLGALKRVALRQDAPSLALRGIAMAQLGDFARARDLLRRASRTFSPNETLARARCVVAEAEVALASRDLGWSSNSLIEARLALERHRDQVNAAHARYIEIRRLVLISRLDEAERMLADVDPTVLPPPIRTVHELVFAGIAIRRLRTRAAHQALARAKRSARLARIPALMAEVEGAYSILKTPAARLITDGAEKPLLLEEVESLLSSEALVVDGCRHLVRYKRTVVSLARRPVLFALARALAEAWPRDVPRQVLLARAFGAKFTDESHRARLRVEIGRLRRKIRMMASIRATEGGFEIFPVRACKVVVLALPIDGDRGAVLAFLADGESWSSSALALALGTSQRTVQRALDSLAANDMVQSFGRGRARRWMTPPLPGFTTTLLISVPLPID